MSMLKEFKEFAMKGNVIDLAIGVVIGAAFNSIVTSLINDVITPLLLKPALNAAHLSNIEQLTFMDTVFYGKFLSAIIQFIMVAFVLFLVVKAINRMKRKHNEAPAAPPEPTTEEKLLMEIRDAIKEKKN